MHITVNLWKPLLVLFFHPFNSCANIILAFKPKDDKTRIFTGFHPLTNEERLLFLRMRAVREQKTKGKLSEQSVRSALGNSCHFFSDLLTGWSVVARRTQQIADVNKKASHKTNSSIMTEHAVQEHLIKMKMKWLSSTCKHQAQNQIKSNLIKSNVMYKKGFSCVAQLKVLYI